MNLRRKNTEPVEVEHVYRFDDGSKEVEVLQGDTDAVPVNGDTDVVAVNGDTDAVPVNGETDVVAVDGDTGPAPAHGDAESAPVDDGAPMASGNGSPSGERRRSLAALLTEAGIASEAQIHQALEEGTTTGEKLGEVVIRRGWASEGRLAQLLAEQWGLRSVDPGALSLDPLAVARVEIGVAAELGGFPVWFDEHGIVVAVSEPNEKRFASFRELLGNVSFVVVPGSTLRELVDSRLFGAHGRSAAPESVQVNGTLAAAAAMADAFETGDEPSGESLDSGGHDEQLEESVVAAPEDTTPTQEPAQVVAVPAMASPGSLVERLRSIELEVQDLEQALVEASAAVAAQQAEVVAARATVEAQEAELVAVREERSRALERIRDLEVELADRNERFQGLRAKVADLSLALDD